MAPFRNTRSKGKPLAAPLPAPTKKKGIPAPVVPVPPIVVPAVAIPAVAVPAAPVPAAPVPAAPVPAAPVPAVPVPVVAVPAAPGGMPSLPYELANKVWESSNEASRHVNLTLMLRPAQQVQAGAPWLPNDHPLSNISANRPPTGSNDLVLLKGHFPSQISKFTCNMADLNYPFTIIRKNQCRLIVRFDISVRDPHRSLWTICSALRSNDRLDTRIYRVEMSGWRSISFHALVLLILECGNYPHLQTRMAADQFHFSDGYSVHMRKLAKVFCADIFKYGASDIGKNNIRYVAKKVWRYLDPPAIQPLGVDPAATWQWDDRRTIRAWMNVGFRRSHTWQEALQQS